MRALALLLMASLLGACSSLPRAPAPSAVATVPSFSLNGRLLAVDGSRRFSAALRWSQGDTTRILLTTPLGQAVASVEAGADGARLTAADGRQFSAPSLSDLARRGLGLSLPLEQLPWWIAGRSAPDAPAETDAGGGFSQLGWTVRYGERDARGRPLRIDAECSSNCGGSQAGSQSGSLSVRLIIDQWLDP